MCTYLHEANSEVKESSENGPSSQLVLIGTWGLGKMKSPISEVQLIFCVNFLPYKFFFWVFFLSKLVIEV